MTLYKLYWKIVKRNRTGILVYFFVFVAMSVLSTMSNSDNSNLKFETANTSVSITNQDSDSALIRGLTDYLGSLIKLEDAPADEDALSDALFFRAIDYSITVPKGFTESFLSDNPLNIKKACINESYGSVYTDTLIDSYLNTWRTCLENQPNITEEQLIKQVRDILDTNTKTSVYAKDSGDKYIKMNVLFDMGTYSMIACLIMAICAVNFSFYNKDVFSRNMVAPVSPRKISSSLLLANCSLTGFAWIFHLIVAFLLFGTEMLTLRGLFLSVNMLCLAIVALAISALVSSCLKNKNAVHFAANTISLAIAFLCGAFVPQELLGSTVLRVAQFLPGYWYVHNVDFICSLTSFSQKDIRTILFYCFVQMLFAAAIFAISLLFSKQQGKENE